MEVLLVFVDVDLEFVYKIGFEDKKDAKIGIYYLVLFR